MTGVKRLQKGFSLAEALMATVVLSVAASGILLPFSAGAKMRVEGAVRTKGAVMASALMEQVVASDFDNIVGYYNFKESAGNVRSPRGGVFGAGYEGLSRKVESSYCYLDSQKHSLSDAVFVKVEVTVYYNGNEVVTLERVFSGGER